MPNYKLIYNETRKVEVTVIVKADTEFLAWEKVYNSDLGRYEVPHDSNWHETLDIVPINTEEVGDVER